MTRRARVIFIIVCASAKTLYPVSASMRGMDMRPVPPLTLLDRKISELIFEYPDFLRLLIRQHTGCVGCALTAFCTFRDAIDYHGLEIEAVVRDALAAVLQPSQAIPVPN